MFNRFKLLVCFIEIHVYASVSKRRILLASLSAGFYAFPINSLKYVVCKMNSIELYKALLNSYSAFACCSVSVASCC